MIQPVFGNKFDLVLETKAPLTASIVRHLKPTFDYETAINKLSTKVNGTIRVHDGSLCIYSVSLNGGSVVVLFKSEDTRNKVEKTMDCRRRLTFNYGLNHNDLSAWIAKGGTTSTAKKKYRAKKKAYVPKKKIVSTILMRGGEVISTKYKRKEKKNNG